MKQGGGRSEMECVVHNMAQIDSKGQLVWQVMDLGSCMACQGVVLNVASAWPSCVYLQRWTSVGSIPCTRLIRLSDSVRKGVAQDLSHTRRVI